MDPTPTDGLEKSWARVDRSLDIAFGIWIFMVSLGVALFSALIAAGFTG